LNARLQNKAREVTTVSTKHQIEKKDLFLFFFTNEMALFEYVTKFQFYFFLLFFLIIFNYFRSL
jgi:hypothetical protein